MSPSSQPQAAGNGKAGEATWRRVYETFSSTQIANFLLGIQRVVEATSPSPSPVPNIPDGARREPGSSAAEPCCLQHALARGQALFKGAVWHIWVFTLLPAQPCSFLTCAGRTTILTGAELAPTGHLFTPTRLPQGFSGCQAQREGVFLRARQVMCKMCSTPSKNLLLQIWALRALTYEQ